MAVLNGSSLMAQNLVPNGSFEEYSFCPYSWSQFNDNIIDWTVLLNSPDYLNSCATNPAVGVPLNNFGFQYPSNGNAYAGLCTFKVNSPYFREYISAELSEPLVIGELVSLSMKVACGGFGASSTMSAGWTGKGIGLRLTTEPYDWQQGIYPNSSHLFMSDVLLDTVNWVLLTNTIVCDSAYRYVTIGNFFDDEMSTPQVLNTQPSADVAYVFVDEICVTHGPDGCEFANSVMQISRSLNVLEVNSLFTDYLNVQFPSPVAASLELRLQDLNGRIVSSIALHPGLQYITWNTQALVPGIYILSAPGFFARRLLHVSP